MKKSAKEERIQIRPDFLNQVKMPGKRGLARLAKEWGVSPEDAAKYVQNQRIVISAKNTGSFYVELFKELYHGRILRETKLPLFPFHDIDMQEGFFPDVVVNGQARKIYAEVKAISTHTAQPFFGYYQIANYCLSLLENKGSKMITGIFKHGGRLPVKNHLCEKKIRGKHKCDNRCLVGRLSKSTKSLLVLPHNLLMFILSLSHVDEMDQDSSNSSRMSETYKRPYGTWLTSLHKNYEEPMQAVDEILEHAKKKLLGLGDLKPEDFFLKDLSARQFQSPDNVYCRNCNVHPFTITEYRNNNFDGWMDHFKKNHSLILENMRVKEVYDVVCERRSLGKENGGEVGKPDDDIPI